MTGILLGSVSFAKLNENPKDSLAAKNKQIEKHKMGGIKITVLKAIPLRAYSLQRYAEILPYQNPQPNIASGISVTPKSVVPKIKKPISTVKKLEKLFKKIFQKTVLCLMLMYFVKPLAKKENSLLWPEHEKLPNSKPATNSSNIKITVLFFPNDLRKLNFLKFNTVPFCIKINNLSVKCLCTGRTRYEFFINSISCDNMNFKVQYFEKNRYYVNY